jgi:hypothetical protein
VLALWWTLLPINYDTVYEIHLFAALPTLAAVVVAVKFSGPRMRAAVFLLLISAVLIRGELLVGLLAWAALWGGYELWRWRRRPDSTRPRELAVRRAGVDSRRPRELAVRLAIPAALAAAVLGSSLTLILMGSSAQFESKQTAVLCQNYAASAEQRGEFAGAHAINRPLSCRDLMRERFGEPLPTWTDALLANPGAMAEHFLFSAELIPQGLQLMLFDQISGGPRVSPDVVPVTTGVPAAMVGLIAVAAFVVYGLVLLWRDRKRWWDGWLRERAWGWAVLGCLAIAAFVVMMTVRPRPSYVFNFSVLVLAVIGMCAFAIGSRWTWTRRLRAGLPLLAIVVLVAVPSRYDTGYSTPQAGQGRPLLEMVERLEPRSEELAKRNTHLLAPQFANEVCAYIVPVGGCRGTALIESIEQKEAATSIAKLIKDLDINLVYADESTLTNPAHRDLMERLDSKGWRVLGPPPSSGAPWTLLRRPDSFADR